MKANIFLTFISVMLAALIGYWIYSISEGQENDMLCGISSAICLVATLIPVLGLQYKSGKLGTNIRVLSVIFFIIFLISHFCFAGFGVKMPHYIICNGILLIIYLAIFYKLQGITDI